MLLAHPYRAARVVRLSVLFFLRETYASEQNTSRAVDQHELYVSAVDTAMSFLLKAIEFQKNSSSKGMQSHESDVPGSLVQVESHEPEDTNKFSSFDAEKADLHRYLDLKALNCRKLRGFIAEQDLQADLFATYTSMTPTELQREEETFRQQLKQDDSEYDTHVAKHEDFGTLRMFSTGMLTRYNKAVEEVKANADKYWDEEERTQALKIGYSNVFSHFFRFNTQALQDPRFTTQDLKDMAQELSFELEGDEEKMEAFKNQYDAACESESPNEDLSKLIRMLYYKVGGGTGPPRWVGIANGLDNSMVHPSLHALEVVTQLYPCLKEIRDVSDRLNEWMGRSQQTNTKLYQEMKKVYHTVHHLRQANLEELFRQQHERVWSKLLDHAMDMQDILDAPYSSNLPDDPDYFNKSQSSPALSLEAKVEKLAPASATKAQKKAHWMGLMEGNRV
jgi:hypothetical protein